MKSSTINFLIFLAFIFPSCNWQHNRISISEGNTQESFRLVAEFPEKRSSEVRNLLKDSLNQAELFSEEAGISKVQFPDGSIINIEYQSDAINFEIPNAKSTRLAYKKLKNISSSLKKQLIN